MPKRGEVLVAIINNKPDFAILHQQRWYRIPVASARKWLKDCWPPRWVAFYQTKAFGHEAYSVRYFARVLQIKQAFRWQLFGDEPESPKNTRLYHKLILDEIRQRPQPILSRRWRRITFIPTTWTKFINATEINDLYDESPLEDRLWAALKRREIPAERQEFVTVDQGNYFLDFAIYCDQGQPTDLKIA
jgi:hypothetical protein